MQSKGFFQGMALAILISLTAAAQDDIKVIVQDGHSGEINTMMVSYNNKYLLTGGVDQHVIVWDVRSGALLHKIEGHRNPIWQAGFDKDDKYVISQDGDAGVIGNKPSRLIITEVGTWKTVLVVDSLVGKTPLKQWKGYFALHDRESDVWNVYSLKQLKHIAKVAEAKFSDYAKKLGYTEPKYNAGFTFNEREVSLKHANRPDTIKLDFGTDTCHSKYRGHFDNYYRASSITKDEKRLALVGWCNRVFINDLTTGALIRTLHFPRVDNIIFSNDGEYLFCSLGRKIQVIRISTGDVVSEFKSLVTPVTNLVTDSANPDRMIIAQDSSIRILDLKDPANVKTFATHSSTIRSLAIHPSGDFLASGDVGGNVIIWDYKTGDKVKTMNTKNSRFTASDIFGSSDEFYYVEKLDFYKRNNDLLLITMHNKVFVWSFNTGHFQRMATEDGIFETDGNDVIIQKMNGDSCIVSSLRYGKYFTIPPPHIPGKKKTLIPESPHLGAIAVSSHEKLVALGGRRVLAIWKYDSLGNRKKIQEIPGCTQYFTKLRFSDDGRRLLSYCNDNVLSVYEKHNESFIKVAEKTVSPLSSITFVRDSHSFFTCDLTGNVTKWSAQGDVEYSTYFFDGNNYFIATSDGYYMSSKASQQGISFAVGDKIIPAQQFDVLYNRPDKVIERINPQDTVMIEAFRKAWQKRVKRSGIDPNKKISFQHVPLCEIVNARDIALDQTSKEVKLKIRASAAHTPIRHWNIWINGVPLFGMRGEPIKSASLDTTINITLSQGRNKIEAAVTSSEGTESFRQPLIVNYSQKTGVRERLYFVGIGIDQFKDSQHNLRYSVKDIRDLAKLFKHKYGDGVTIDTLMNTNVTVANIKALKASLLSTDVDDKLIVAYSGHGLLDKDFDYYLSTYEIDFSAPEKLGLAYQELEELMDGIPARKKLLLIDACHSGEVDKDDIVVAREVQQTLGTKGVEPVISTETTVGMKNSFELMQDLFVNVSKSTGSTVISAAAGTQFALERGDLKNGVFTFSILEAFQNYPALTVGELKKIVGERVPELTKGLQRPTFRNEQMDSDWRVW